MNGSLGRLTTTGFVIALMLVIAIGVIAYTNAQVFIETNRLVTHTVEVLGELEAVLSRVTEAETNQRGYVITGNSVYVEAHDAAKLRLEDSFARVQELTADNPDQQVRLGILKILIDEKFGITDNAIHLRRTGGFLEAQQLALVGRGRQIMDNIRDNIQSIKDAERQLLDSRRAQSEMTAGDTLLMFALFTVIAAGLLSLVYVLINRDITGRKQAEEAARRYADEVQDLYDHAPCGYHSVDSDTTFVQINQTELDWLGYTREEVIGKLKFSDVISAASLPVLEAKFPIIKERGWTNGIEFEMKRKDGSTFMVLLNATAVTDENGQFVRTRSTLVDITDRKRAEEALRISEERWRSLVENAPDVITTMDLDGRFQFINRLPPGVHREDVIDRCLHDLVLPEQRDGLRQVLEDVRARGKAASYEVTSLVNSLHYTNHIGPIQVDGEMVGFIMTSTDITERRKTEEHVRRLNRDLERHTAELEAINKELEAFTYSVSHDLRAPLRAMNGFSKQLHEKYRENLPERAQHYLSRIQQNSERMGILIDDLLTLSRLGRQSLNMRAVQPRALVQDIARELNITGEYPEVRLTIDELPECHADPTLLKQVYLNLLTNALKFSSKVTEPEIHVGFRNDQDEVVYFVKDNGVGFDMEFADKLFGVFERLHTSREFDGTGVGLATVQRIVHRHGGRVWAQAEPGQGATFYFTLQGRPEDDR